MTASFWFICFKYFFFFHGSHSVTVNWIFHKNKGYTFLYSPVLALSQLCWQPIFVFTYCTAQYIPYIIFSLGQDQKIVPCSFWHLQQQSEVAGKIVCNLTGVVYHLVKILKLVSCIFLQMEDLYLNRRTCLFFWVLNDVPRSCSHSRIHSKEWGSEGVISRS